jgi:tRNA (cytidine/uridine-2'-O-)-methyltransferase
MARVTCHAELGAALQAIGPTRLFAVETDGVRSYHEVAFHAGDSFLFGPETRGLPIDLSLPQDHERIRIPMRAGNRSLNLSNSVAVVVYEAWRQNGFA